MGQTPEGTTTRVRATAETIRQMILGGKLPAGERLRAQKLADHLGVSRTPVTEALAVLHREGLLEYGVNRGYGVKRFGVKSFMDAYDARQVLEGLACRLAAERGLKPEVALRLEQNIDETEEALFGDRWDAVEQESWRLLNFEYHDLLLASADNAFVSAAVANARALPPIFDSGAGEALSEFWPQLDRNYSQQAYSDHRRILEAVLAGQGTRAESLMREHVFAGREKARQIVEQQLSARS